MRPYWSELKISLHTARHTDNGGNVEERRHKGSGPGLQIVDEPRHQKTDDIACRAKDDGKNQGVFQRNNEILIAQENPETIAGK